MKYNNNLTESELVSKSEPLIIMHLTLDDVVVAILRFGYVSATMDIDRTRIREQAIQRYNIS